MAMTYDGTRLTLITTAASQSPIEWKAVGSRTRLAFFGSLTSLRIALDLAVGNLGLDVERVIVDRTGASDDFLNFLARTPRAFAGDALFLREDGTGWLSATSGGTRRVFHWLSVEEVDAFLADNDLVSREERMSA